MRKFENTNVHIGTIKPNSENIVSFNFDGKASDIYKDVHHCGCTAKDTIIKDGIYQITYEERGVKNLTVEYLLARKQENNPYYNFKKDITIFWNDGRPLKITKTDGSVDFNPEKEKTTISFYGRVDITELINNTEYV